MPSRLAAGLVLAGSLITCMGQELGPAPVRTRDAEASVLIPQGLAAVSSWYDTTNRAAIAEAYKTVYHPTRYAPMLWAGDPSAGDAGDTNPAWKDAVLARINWYRAMAGVPPGITFDPALSALAQKGALMLFSNEQLNHFPPATWINYTAEGAGALSKSNICMGLPNDPGCVELYIHDSG